MIRLPTELNSIIEQGGTVVVPSRQRAHAARLAHAGAKLAAGNRVWATPDILPVEAWLTREVERYAAAAGAEVPRLLSPAEEWLLWRQCAAEATGELELVNRGALAESLRKASAIAADYGIDAAKLRDVLEAGALATGMPATETALLGEVQRAVDERCRLLGATTVASLVGRLRSCEGGPPVIFRGFLKLSPRLQPFAASARQLNGSTHDQFSAIREADVHTQPKALIAADELDELERIAQWCSAQIERKPDARILVTLPGSPGVRERLATLIRQAVNPRDWLGDAPTGHETSNDVPQAQPSGTSFHVPSDSLVVIEGGGPLARVPAVAHALATLSWLGGNTGDFEAVSGWLRAPYWRTPASSLRARLDLWLRERERMHFDLHELVASLSSAPSALAAAARELSVQVKKAAAALGEATASPRDWSERFRAALEAFGWPGERARNSGQQQTVVRFHELLDEFGQLAAAARSISRDSAIQWFTELATRTAFRPADDDAVVTISAMFADPVVRYDAIWIAGLHAEAFPQPVQPDPFLPLTAQLAAGVPAASAGGRLAEAQALVTSWRAAADELVLSAPARSEDLELLPSPLLAEWLVVEGGSPRDYGAPDAPRSPAMHDVPPRRDVMEERRTAPERASMWLPVRMHREGMLETFEDAAGLVWPAERPLPSGTRSLELQNQCPFRAYAELRLGSTPLGAPEPGIAPDLRGQLLHAALQRLWMQLGDSQALAALSDASLDALIHQSVEEAADTTLSRLPHAIPLSPAADLQGDLFNDSQRSPALERECRRATRLIRTLCNVERERAPFRVESTELESTLTLMGAHLRVRIDRVDALASGGRAILDYKSGRRTTADWYGERPSHPQLLAYLVAVGEDVVAMATINVTAKEVRFDGIANSPELLPKVKGVEAAFGTDPLDAWPLRRREWLDCVEHLAAAFLAGRAEVDPKPGACDYCHVASICRISDRVASASTDASAALSESSDE